MQVLIDYRPALRERTGVGEYIHELARALAARTALSDPHITLFSSSWKDRVDRSELDNLDVVDRRIPVSMLTAAWHRLSWPPVEWLTGRRFDVVHSPHPLLVPSRAAAQVITIHDLHFLAHAERTEAEVRRDYPALVARHARQADRILVSSRYTAGEVHRLLGIPEDRIALCPPGAPPWPPRRTTPPGGCILFLGTLEPRKNIGILLDAYSRLVAAHTAAPPLVLAGKPTAAARPWLEALGRPPLAGRVRYVGYVRAEERRRLYESAAVFVMPSLEEGFGLPVLEAMTVGVPVVASNRGSLPEVLDGAGLLIDPMDPVALAAAIERLVTEEALARACAERGLARARAFSWPAAAAAACDAYRDAIRTRQLKRH